MSCEALNAHAISRFILTDKRRGLSSLLFRRSGCWTSLVTQSNQQLQIIIDQANRDDSVRALLSKMDQVYIFLTTAGLNDIKAMKATVDRITRQTLECSYFIQAYYGNQKFRKLTYHDAELDELSVSFKGRDYSRTCPPKQTRSCSASTMSLTIFYRSSATGLQAIH